MTTPRLFTDIRYAVDNDRYMWIVFWGPPRSTKTTIAGWVLHSLYKDWPKVLAAFVFNLPQVIYKMKHGIPEKWPTIIPPFHDRVPMLLWDDFGAHSNKAVTQHNLAWDEFKGGFDVLGTKIGILGATMVSPTEPTFQIMSKYTHEVFVPSPGIYKYDKVKWKQDYRGWKPKQDKDWIETNTFDPWPDDVYKEYDEMRVSLADEVFVRIEDAMATSQVDSILKRIQQFDVQILDLIHERGPLYSSRIKDKLGDESTTALVRLKARNLIVPVRKKGTYYVYDMTDLGVEVREAYYDPDRKPVKNLTHPKIS